MCDNKRYVNRLGADPFVVDAMLRARGDYRPHAAFGVDLAVRCAL
jgi:hypothetical protein